MERKQRKAKVEFKDKTLLIDITDYESSILPALVERIKKEYKTEEFFNYRYIILKGDEIQMKIYYLEFENSVKFFRNDRSIEIEKSKLLELFLKAVYKKYGKKLKFECLL